MAETEEEDLDAQARFFLRFAFAFFLNGVCGSAGVFSARFNARSNRSRVVALSSFFFGMSRV